MTALVERNMAYKIVPTTTTMDIPALLLMELYLHVYTEILQVAYYIIIGWQ